MIDFYTLPKCSLQKGCLAFFHHSEFTKFEEINRKLNDRPVK